MISSFHPPLRTLMGPGPSDVYPRVLEALSRPTVGHLDPSFIRMMDEVKSLLQTVFRTKNELTMVVSGPGSAGMETCFANLVEKGDTVAICQNGAFGGRMKEMAERCGGKVILVEDSWGRAIDPAKFEDALKRNPEARLAGFVHAETSTGVLSDVKTLAEIAHRHDCVTVVDAVTSLGGVPLEVDAWELDAVYSGTQKCLSCVPGLSPVTFGPRAVEKLKKRSAKVQSWFMDLNLVMAYWGSGAKRAYHHTAPINALYGLHEALVILLEEGLEASWARHRAHHEEVRAGVEAMGLELIVPPPERLPQLNAISVPKGVDESAVRTALLDGYNLEIGAGLGSLAGKIWRVGLMGCGCNRKNVVLFLSALNSVLKSMNAPSRSGETLQSARVR